MPTIADPPAADSLRQETETTWFLESSRGTGIRVLTPAGIASWAAGLVERAELCLAVGGTRRGKLTIYAGPEEGEGLPVAILTGINGHTYVSRAWNSDIEEWIASILRSAKALADAL